MSHWESELFCTAFNKEQLPPPQMPEVAMVGRSNVGKSTLINAMLGKRVARISSTPGKTRSINFYNVRSGKIRFCLVDLPGYGYAARGADERRGWWKLIDEYFSTDRDIVFVMHLVDFRHGPLANDNELTEWLNRINMQRLVVFTKGDKIAPGKRRSTLESYMATGLVSMHLPFVTAGKNDSSADALRACVIDAVSR